MSKNDVDIAAAGTAEWDEAWQLVCRLASTRREIIADSGNAATWASEPAKPSSISGSILNREGLDREELARAIAEIEQASTALRQLEPTLESWRPEETTKIQPRNPQSTWLAIAALWMLVALITIGALTSIPYFLPW